MHFIPETSQSSPDPNFIRLRHGTSVVVIVVEVWKAVEVEEVVAVRVTVLVVVRVLVEVALPALVSHQGNRLNLRVAATRARSIHLLNAGM